MMLSRSSVRELQRFGPVVKAPKLSVIIVAYKTGDELFACLDSLLEQTYQDFEIIIVDNDRCDIRRLTAYQLRYLRLDKNYGPSYARNLGAEIAKGDILLFLDDDAIADPNWTASAHKALSRDKTLSAVRGKVIPKRNNYRNKLAFHYDLGDAKHAAYLDLEGNCAIRASAYKKIGGFNADLFGGEGLDISYRLESAKQGSIAYIPDMIIYHSFVDSWKHFAKKFYRHGRNEARLDTADAAVTAYKNSFKAFYERRQTPPFFERGMLFATFLVGRAIEIIGRLTK